MKKSAIGKTAIWSVSLLFAGMLLTGCSQSSPGPTSQTPNAVGTFTGQELPSKVEELEGTPLYSVSEEIATLQEFDGATFLLIAPQDPTKALLVFETGTRPEELAKRESKPIKVSGVKEVVDSEKLVTHVLDRYQLALQTDAEGKVVVLKISGPEKTPEASSSSSVDESDKPSE